MIGKLLSNRYEVLELIGEGGMARVYKARCHLLNRFVAIKMLRPEYVSDEEFLRKFEKEAQSSASLSHPNIVNVYDVGVEQRIPYIVMELVNGLTLKNYIQKKSTFLSTTEICQIGRQVAMALDHAHSNQIIHRDIKPHNILITDDGHVKVADFGIARATTSATIVKTNEAMGSVHYVSPEQARGGYVDGRSDLYSLGIVLFEMATGRVPFEGDSPVTVALKHLKESVVPPTVVNAHLSPSLEAVIMKLIQKEPMMRYQSAARLVEDLDRIILNPSEKIDVFLTDMDSPTTKLPSMEQLESSYGRPLRPEGPGASFKPQKRKMAVAVIGAFVLALLIIVPTVFFALGGGSNTVEVPDVVNMTQDEAQKALTDKGLKAKFEDAVKDNNVEAGKVVSTNPVAGEKVKKGYAVTVEISTGGGSGTIRVPDLYGKLQADAEAMLTAKKLKLGKAEQVDSDQPEGTVLSQDPIASTKVRAGDTVDITVSKGTAKAKLTMPKLTGHTLAEVKDILTQYKLVLGKVTQKADASVDPGIVISQSVEQGAETTEETVIDITISQTANGTDTGATGDKLIDKTVFVPLNFDKDEDVLKVFLQQNGSTKLVYQRKHQRSENTAKVTVKGSGTGTLLVYYGETYVYSEPISFN